MTNKYLQQNPDVAAAYQNDVRGLTANQYADWHYATYGAGEGRDAPSAAANYVSQNQDLIDYYNTNKDAHGLGSITDYGNFHWNTFGQYEDRSSPFSDPALNRQYQELQKQYNTMSTQYSGRMDQFQEQLKLLQSHYEKLLQKAAKGGDGIVGGGVVPGDGSVIGGGGINQGGGGFGNGGVVYGPDGTMYSSPAAALAAGVSNFTSTPPSGTNPNGPPSGQTGDNLFMQGGYQTGNSNPGGFISGANQQLFQYGRPAVGFPY